MGVMVECHDCGTRWEKANSRKPNRCPDCQIERARRLRAAAGGNPSAVIRAEPGYSPDVAVLEAIRATPGTAIVLARRLGRRHLLVAEAVARLWFDGLVTRGRDGVYAATRSEAA